MKNFVMVPCLLQTIPLTNHLVYLTPGSSSMPKAWKFIGHAPPSRLFFHNFFFLFGHKTVLTLTQSPEVFASHDKSHTLSL